MKKTTTIRKKNKANAKKGGYSGNEMWEAHRLEGVVENKGIKEVKKKGKNKDDVHFLDKAHNPDKVHKELPVENMD